MPKPHFYRGKTKGSRAYALRPWSALAAVCRAETYDVAIPVRPSCGSSSGATRVLVAAQPKGT